MCSTSFGKSNNLHRRVETSPDSEGALASPNMFTLGWPVLSFFMGGISAPKEMKGEKKMLWMLDNCVVSYIAIAVVAKLGADSTDNGWRSGWQWRVSGLTYASSSGFGLWPGSFQGSKHTLYVQEEYHAATLRR